VRPGRGRRLALVVGLVVVFSGSLLAGWALADPAAFAGVAGGDRGAPAPTAPPLGAEAPASAAPGGAGTTVVPTAPVASEVPGSAPPVAPSPTPSPTPSSSPAPAVPAAMASRLDRALARAQESFLLPGVEATVIFPDGSTWTGTRGMADVAAGRPVVPATPFAVGSVTKTFTAALILRYVDQGRIGLDDRLDRYLPDWPKAASITVRMLLNHTSGIPDFFLNPKLDAALNKAKKHVWTAAEVLESYVQPGAVFPPGKGWAYSNTNYLLLGVIAEQVGGAPWATLVREELFEPLGLAATYVQQVQTPPAEPARAYSMLLGNRGPVPRLRSDGTDVVPFTSVVTAAGSAGAIAATTGDLARWARALYGTPLLSKATRKEMLTFVRATSYGKITSYGLGVSRVKLQGRYAIGHSGALAGSRAAIRYFPKDGIAIAVAFNRETFVGDDVVGVLARALFPAPAASPSPGTSAGPSKAP
jgi:CubicO group peptidase (beta-lactamase class C family)